jgi:uncharacterized damage-inducible protein DinB
MLGRETRNMIYGAKELADSFRTVRKNTIQIAEDIPEDQYGFRAAADVQSVAEDLAHIACAPAWQQQAHGVDKKTSLGMEDFAGYFSRAAAMEKALATKAQILDALRRNGEEFATFLEGMTDEALGERVTSPANPSGKTRLEMLMGVKEHEMHHRAKLMVVERLLGIVPHLTRARQQMMASMSAAAAPRA